MFKSNKYTRIYNRIISNAKNRILTEYKENHHIIPRSMGGTDDPTNLVDLTAREHFICHWLLIKMVESQDRAKLVYAINAMKLKNKNQNRYSTKVTARVYENYRLEWSAMHSQRMKGRTPPNKGVPMSEQQKQLLREVAAKRPPQSAETKAKRAKSITGRKLSEETKQKIAMSLTGKVKGPYSTARKRAISDACIGISKKEGHKENVANAVKGNISINKNGIEKKVKSDILQEYLNDGWNLGGRKRKLD